MKLELKEDILLKLKNFSKLRIHLKITIRIDGLI